MSSEGFHEPIERLSKETMDRHRAIVSLMEELEAIDWYSQRMDATEDAELREILEHNRDEEVEHATMILEWLRRRDPVFERNLAGRLFRSGPIAQDEEDAADASAGGDGRLGIGSLKADKAGEAAKK